MKLLKSLTWLLVMLLALGLVVGCGDDDDDDDDSAAMFDQIAAAGGAYFPATQNIMAADLYQELDNENYVIFDWRSEELYNEGHIPGAHYLYFTMENVLTDSLEKYVTDKENMPVVNYCYSGQTASQVTAIMNLMGYNATNLKFGATGWKDTLSYGWPALTVRDDLYEMLTTESAEPGAPTETFDYPTLESNAATVADAVAELAMEYWHMDYDGRNGVLYVNASAQDVLTQSGRFSNPDEVFVVNYKWPMDLYTANHVPGAYLFEPDATITSLGLDGLSYLPADKKIVVYCYTGQTSSQVAGYLRTLGYEAYSMAYGISGLTNDTSLGGGKYTTYQANYPWHNEQ
jgi:rhodanese-related sulfurtransferase